MRYIVLALLFVAVIGTAGFLALSQKRGPQDSPTPSPSSTLTQETSPTDNPTQPVTDEMGLIQFELPAEWDVIKEGTQGVRISGIQAESPDFTMRSDEDANGPFTPIYYESGAQLQVSIQNDTRPPTDRPTGKILEETQVRVDGIEADYYRYKEPSTIQGEIMDVRFSHDGKSYFFRFGHNPDTLPSGEHLFFTIIDSVRLTK